MAAGSLSRIVIIGAGFGGLAAARTLRNAPADITLIDRTNHHLFQPLLYQAATGVLSPADIASPVRRVLSGQRNLRVVLAEVHAIDAARREVQTSQPGQTFAYDYLIVATGARHSYFGKESWEPLAPGLKTLEDARTIRSRFLSALEQAEQTADPEERAALLTFVIVGGGPTGVELAGILPAICHTLARRDYRRVRPRDIRVLLVEGGDRLLSTFPEKLSARALRDLQRLGAEVRLGAHVTEVAPDYVCIGDERVPTRTVLWAAGNEASPLPARLGCPTDRMGRALVRQDLSAPERPEVFIIGDAAAAPRRPQTHAAGNGAPPDWTPGVAPAARQMGEHAARNILRRMQGKPTEPFRYLDKGNLAVIGRNRAVADIGPFETGGLFAWLLWLFVHILYLVGFRNRLGVLLAWGYAYFTNRGAAGLISERDRRATPHAAAPEPLA